MTQSLQPVSRRTLTTVAIVGGLVVAGLLITVLVLLSRLGRDTPGGGLFGDSSSRESAVSELAILPASVPPEDRNLRWYRVGDESIALLSLIKIANGGTARFRILDAQGLISTATVNQGERLPTLVTLTLAKVTTSAVRVMSADAAVDLLLAERPLHSSLAPDAQNPERIAAVQIPSDGFTQGIGLPKDPRIAANMPALGSPPGDPRGPHAEGTYRDLLPSSCEIRKPKQCPRIPGRRRGERLERQRAYFGQACRRVDDVGGLVVRHPPAKRHGGEVGAIGLHEDPIKI